MEQQDILNTLHYCQNKLLDIKWTLEDMGLWEEVEQRLKELEQD